MSRSDLPLCPSAQPEWEGSVAIGVVGGTAEEPRVTPLEQPVVVSKELLALAQPVKPTEVFRFAAPCMCGGCQHFKESKCNLATKIVQMLPQVTDDLPPCEIRPQCRWFMQEGKEACMRCPQVVTNNYNPSETMLVAADPTTPVSR